MASTRYEKLTAKQEKFCEVYVTIGNASGAYRAAYNAAKMSEQAVHVNASKLLKNTKVALRVAELESMKASTTESVAERMEISIERTLEELARIAYSSIGDFVRIDSDGLAYVDLSGAGRAKMSVIQEINTDEFKDGRGKDAPVILRTKLKMMDKKGALVDLLKHLIDAKQKKADDRPEDERPRSPGEDALAELKALYGGALAGTVSRH